MFNKQTDIFKLAPSPEEAVKDWERFRESYRTETKREFELKKKQSQLFLKIFGNSRFLARFVNRHPECVDTTLTSPFLFKEKKGEQFLTEIGQIKKGALDQRINQIRFYKYCELLRITLKDLSGGHDEEVLRELSFLAYAILSEVDKRIYKESRKTPQSHHFLALGKLGGCELNYSSDVDLLAIIENDEDSEFFIRHSQLFASTLQANSEEGFLYRVDWDLRPEGKSGVLVNSLKALESYYENFGSDWERHALTKSHLAAGNQELGTKFIKAVEPFVYRKYFDLENIRRIQLLKQRIHEDLYKQERVQKGYNVKLGIGGIREIEFFVQTYLVLFGGRKPELRHTNTLEALSRVEKAKFISRGDSKILRQGYLFLRKLEHRLQMVDETQTHIVPDEDSLQIKIARQMDYISQDPKETLNQFQKDLAETTAKINKIFDNLFSEKIPFSALSFSTVDEKASVVSLAESLNKRLDSQKDFETKLDEIRSFKHEETEKIIPLEKNPFANRKKILFQLSYIAEAVCHESLKLAIKMTSQIYGTPTYTKKGEITDTSHLIAVGMGKLGGFEINYGSDLDMIFIYSENGNTTGPKQITNQEFFVRVVQKFISILSVSTRRGIAYNIDAELRPSGHFGPLVTTLESFVDYQKKTSQIWERQSLLRARPIFGPAHLSRLVYGQIKTLLFSIPFKDEIRQEMNRLRMRVEKEVAKETAEYFDLKNGKGGLLDIEFILQLFQLRWGSQHPDLQTPNTLDGLDKLIALSLFSHQDDIAILKEAYMFYRTLESQIFLKLKRSVHRLSVKNPLLREIGKEFDFNLYHSYSQKVRSIYNKIFTSTPKRPVRKPTVGWV